LLLLPTLADALKAARTDPLDLTQKRRALVDDGQGTFTEDLDDLAGEVRADPLDEAGAEVLGDALGGVRRRGAQVVGLELRAGVADLKRRPGAPVLGPRPRGRAVPAAGSARQPADDGAQAAPPAGLNAQHREPAVRVVKGDALDDTGEGFGHNP